MGEMAALLISQGVSTAANAGNTYAQTEAAKGQQSYASGMSQVNAQWAGMQADDVTRRVSILASRERLQGKQDSSTFRAQAAGRGVDVNSGSAAQGASEARLFADLRQSDTQNAAYRQALGLRAEQASILGRDRLNRMATRNYVRNSYLQLGSEVGSDALRSYARYERYQGLGGQTNPTSAKDAWRSKEMD